MSYHAKTTLRHDIHATTCDISGQPWYCAYTPPPPQVPHNAQSRQSQQPGHLYKKKNTYAKKQKKIGGKGGLRNLW